MFVVVLVHKSVIFQFLLWFFSRPVFFSSFGQQDKTLKKLSNHVWKIPITLSIKSIGNIKSLSTNVLGCSSL